MKHLYLAILLLGALQLPLAAQLRSEAEARSNVADFLSHMEESGVKARANGQAVHPTLVYATERLYAYDAGDRFVLAGGDRSMPPIMGYSDRGTFGHAMENDCFRALIHHIAADWNPDFRIYKPSNVAEAVEPLCHDAWHQFTPFNDMTPLVDGERCVTGCVATSMSELMQYYKHPLRGSGSYEYDDSTGCGQVVRSDFSAHTYDWANIIDDYGYEGSVSYSEAQARAVAQLSYDCGVSVKMRYGTLTSGASVVRQPIALVNYFGYDEGMQMLYRGFYNQCEWDSIMFNELNEGRPMLVGGWSQTLGHSYLCDGYDNNGFFHLRIGNPLEDANGYYYFTWSTPLQPTWYDINSAEGGFNLLQCLIVGVQPKKGDTPSPQRYCFAFSHIDPVGSDTLRVASGNSFCIAVHDLCNCGWNEHKGIVGIALKAKGEGRETKKESTLLLHTYPHPFSLEELTDTTYTDTLTLTIPANVDEGSYRIVPVYEENGLMVEARTMVGMPNNLTCQVTTEGVAVAQPVEERSALRMIGVDFPTLLYSLDRPVFNYTLTNEGAEYSGRLYTCLYDAGSPEKLYMFGRQGVSIERGETQTYRFSHTRVNSIPSGSNYRLIIYADVDLFTDSLVVLYEDKETAITMRGGTVGVERTNPGLQEGKGVVWYDLNGRRVADPSALPRHNIYIEVREDGTVRKMIR